MDIEKSYDRIADHARSIRKDKNQFQPVYTCWGKPGAKMIRKAAEKKIGKRF